MVAGRPLAEPWIAERKRLFHHPKFYHDTDPSLPDADAIISQFYPGELGGLALAEVIFGDVNPSGMSHYVGFLQVLGVILMVLLRQNLCFIPSQRRNCSRLL